MANLPSDESVLAYLESKGMMRAVEELQLILRDEHQAISTLAPLKKKRIMKDRISRLNHFNESSDTRELPIDLGRSPPRFTKIALTSDDAPTSAPSIVLSKKRFSYQKPVAIVSPPTVFGRKDEETVDSPLHTQGCDPPSPSKRRSWIPKRVINAETYREENPGAIPDDDTVTVNVTDLRGEIQEQALVSRRSWTPKRVLDAETFRKENPDAIDDRKTKDIDEGESPSQPEPQGRSSKIKRIVDTPAYRQENPSITLSPSDNNHDDVVMKVNVPTPETRTKTRRSRERFCNLDVDESNHSVLSNCSAASDGLEGRCQRQRSKSASTFLSKTTHSTMRKQPLGRTEKHSDGWTNILTPSDADDTTAASTRSSGSRDEKELTTRMHERRLSDEIPLESFHCEDNNDHISGSLSATHADGIMDDGSGNAQQRKSWRVKRVIDAETYQREEESRDIFRPNLSKFIKQDNQKEGASALEGILSPRNDSNLNPQSTCIDLCTSPMRTSHPRNVSNEVLYGKSFGKDLSKRHQPPLVEESVPSLKDRIGMFSKHQSQPPSFLSAKHMKKLVAKEDDPSIDESSEVSIIVKKPPLLPRKNTNRIPAKTAIKNGLSVRQPSIKDLLPPPKKSLDVKKDEEVRKKLQRADSFDRKGRLRRQKSALLNQKSTTKKAVFVPVSAKPAEDLSKFKLAMFPKDPEAVAVIKSALRSNFVFDMKDHEMDPFVGAFEQVTVAQGEVIMNQGDVGDYFYVVAYGSVAFHVNGRKVGSTGQGKTFGEMSLLYACPRASTAVAECPSTRLFRVDQKSFRFVLRNQTKESEKKKEKLLRGIPFLKHLGEEDLHRLSSVMTPCLFETGDYIVKFGERGDSCYVIQDGKVRVTDIVVGNISYEDVNLEAGDYFGEGALISTEPRAASVVAMTKGSAFAIDRATFKKVLGGFEELVAKSQDRQKLEGIKIFRDSNLTGKNLDTLVSHLKDKEFKAGQIIFKEKARVESALYLVRQGTVQLSALDGSRAEEITSGGYFGQEQLLADTQGKHKLAKYTVTVGQDGCVCGVLTLKSCRSVFNTKKMEDGVHGGGSVYKQKKRALMIDSMNMAFSPQELNKERMLGEGEYAQVWLVSRSVSGVRHEYALKIPHRNSSSEGKEEAMEAFRREVMVLQQLHHPCIVDLYRTFVKDDGAMDMMMEAIQGGELWNRIHREGQSGEWESGMTEKQTKFYALCLADALAYIHREQFVFRDLKPENILLDGLGYPKLVDFGFAKYCPDNTYTFCGTPNYLAPEIVRNHGHGAGVDHWGLGVVTYEMLTGENPFYFEDMDQIALFESIVTEDFYPLPETSSPAMSEFISGLLEKDPVRRLGALAGRESDILRHKWFSDMDLEMLRKKEIRAPWIPK